MRCFHCCGKSVCTRVKLFQREHFLENYNPQLISESTLSKAHVIDCNQTLILVFLLKAIQWMNLLRKPYSLDFDILMICKAFPPVLIKISLSMISLSKKGVLRSMKTTGVLPEEYLTTGFMEYK